MSGVRDEEQLELGFERGKRVEFTYDEPEQQEEKQAETKYGQTPEPEQHRRRKGKAAAILIAAAFCAIPAGLAFWFFGKNIGGQDTPDGTYTADETQDADNIQNTDGAQHAVTLSEDYKVHLELLKSYLSQTYFNADMIELEESGEYRVGNTAIMIADLNSDGVRPEAIILTEYVSSMEELMSSQLNMDEAQELVIVYFDLKDQLQTCSVEISRRELPAQSLTLCLKEDDTAQLILYKQDLSKGTGCSQLYEYNPHGTARLLQLGEVSGKITSQLILTEDDEAVISYDLNGVYQVRETASGDNGYGSYEYERIYSYTVNEDLNTLVPMNFGRSIGVSTGENTAPVYYELEHMPWWNMRRPLLTVMPDYYMSETYLNIREREVLYGTEAHLIGGFSDTDMYMVETDYGDRGIILLSDLEDLDSCMVDIQGLPFFEVFALAAQEEPSEELYAYLDMHITAPGYYKIDEPCYVWIDLNGDGAEQRFWVNQGLGIGGQAGSETLIPFYIEHSDETVRYLTVTDLDPADHRMEIGISEFFMEEGADELSDRAFTCLYQSLDGKHLAQISETQWKDLHNNVWISDYYFTPFDLESGEANYEEGKVWLEFTGFPDYIVQAVYDGQNLRIEDETFAVLREPVQAVTALSGLIVQEENSLDGNAVIDLPQGTSVVVDGFMLKMDTTFDVFGGMDAFLYRLHLSTDQGAYYTGYMTRYAVREMLGLQEFAGIPYQE